MSRSRNTRRGDRKDILMSEFERNYAAVPRFRADRAIAVDAGLRAHMLRVYNYMAAGVALTGVVAWLTFQLAVTTTSAGTLAVSVNIRAGYRVRLMIVPV